MNSPATWTEKCKALAEPIVEACTVAAVASGPGALTREIGRRLPDLAFRQVLCRGGWYRLGGVVDGNGTPVADNLEAWTEAGVEESGDDICLLLDQYAGSGLWGTALLGRTHYFVAPVGSGAADYLQLEIEDLQEAWSHPLFDREPAPGTIEEFVDPRLPRESLKPLGLPRYVFRRLTHVGDTLARMRTQALEPQPIHRFVSDWEAGSARQATDLANHWVIALREHLDRYRQTVTRAVPVSATNGEPPRFAAREGTRGLALHEALAAFDRHAGYPFAWYYHMLTTKAVPHWVARTVAEDAAAGFAYLPERDLAIVKGWLHKPYGF